MSHKRRTPRFRTRLVDGEWRFVLCAGNGQPLVWSGDYRTKQAMYRGIESVRRNALKAIIEELEPSDD